MMSCRTTQSTSTCVRSGTTRGFGITSHASGWTSWSWRDPCGRRSGRPTPSSATRRKRTSTRWPCRTGYCVSTTPDTCGMSASEYCFHCVTYSVHLSLTTLSAVLKPPIISHRSSVTVETWLTSVYHMQNTPLITVMK